MNIISDYHYFSNKFIPFKDPATKEVYEFDFKVIDKKHISTLNSFIDFDIPMDSQVALDVADQFLTIR